MDKKNKFAFQELEVWQKAVDFANDVITITEAINTARKHVRLLKQIESACISVALNIAEGKGRYSERICSVLVYCMRLSLREHNIAYNI
jgi:four helix bundle protein